MNLVLNLTEHCNLRCSYCYYKENEAHASMSLEVLEQSLAFAWHRVLELRHRQLNITFFGGEPLLQKELIRAGVKLARSLQPAGTSLRFAVNTNGTLLDEETLSFFEQEQFRIYLSLDGPAPIHDSQRPLADGSGSFGRIQPWLSRLSRLDTVVLRVVSRHHLGGLAKSMAWIRSQGFVQMTTAVDFDGGWTEENLETLMAEYRALGAYWLERRAQGDAFYLGTLQDKMRLMLEGKSYRQATCHILEGALAVSVTGDLFPCTRFVSNAPSAPYRLGSIYTGLSETLQREIRDYLGQDKECCADCALKPRCIAHGCACVSYYTTGTLQGVSPEVCAHERLLAPLCDELAQQVMNSVQANC